MGISACIDHIIDLIEAVALKREPSRGLQALERAEGHTPSLDSLASGDRRFVIRAGLTHDDGEAGVTVRRQEVELVIRIRYDIGLGVDMGSLDRRINEDITRLSDAITNPNAWDASTGLDDIARPSNAALRKLTAPGASEPHAYVVEVPVMLRYYEG